MFIELTQYEWIAPARGSPCVTPRYEHRQININISSISYVKDNVQKQVYLHKYDKKTRPPTSLKIKDKERPIFIKQTRIQVRDLINRAQKRG